VVFFWGFFLVFFGGGKKTGGNRRLRRVSERTSAIGETASKGGAVCDIWGGGTRPGTPLSENSGEEAPELALLEWVQKTKKKKKKRGAQKKEKRLILLKMDESWDFQAGGGVGNLNGGPVGGPADRGPGEFRGDCPKTGREKSLPVSGGPCTSDKAGL